MIHNGGEGEEQIKENFVCKEGNAQLHGLICIFPLFQKDVPLGISEPGCIKFLGALANPV